MKLSKLFAVTALTVSTLGMASSVSANEFSVDKSITSALVSQGQQVAAEMTSQLKDQIKAELNNFSISVSLPTLTEEDEKETAKAKEVKESKIESLDVE